MEQMSLPGLLDSAFPTNKIGVDTRKLRGGYYTPPELAEFLVGWGLRKDTRRILEPSCGDGNFILAILQHLQTTPILSANVTAVELMAEELNKAKQRTDRFGKNGTFIDWHRGDFFSTYGKLKQAEKFDLVVGNPPFIRFQHFDDASRKIAFSHLRHAGYKPTKLANAWAAFVQLSIEILETGGRLAMVVPAELLQVKYAHELRNRLASHFEHIVIVGFKKLVFPEIQQEVVLLLADGKHESASASSYIHTIEVRDREDLMLSNSLSEKVAHAPAKHSRNGMKWTALFLDETTFDALDEAEKAAGLAPLGTFAQVDVGIVTGRNSFFVISKEQQAELAASDYTVPIIGRTGALRTTNFDPSDFCNYSEQYPSFLLDLTDVAYDSLPQSIKDYIKAGEQENIHRGYKCRIRKRWYDVPSIYVPNAFMFRQIHRYPLVVANNANATSTDTIHRVRVKPGIDVKLLAAACFNSLTLAWAEVCGRSYGGGVLELEPGEAEELPVYYQDDLAIDVEMVEHLLREERPYEALDHVDGVILKDRLGFDDLTISRVRNAWEQLRDRRIERK